MRDSFELKVRACAVRYFCLYNCTRYYRVYRVPQILNTCMYVHVFVHVMESLYKLAA